MLFRIALAVTCSVVAYSVSQLRKHIQRPPSARSDEKQERDCTHKICCRNDPGENPIPQDEEEEEVKTVSSCYNSSSSSKSFQEEEQLLLPEIFDEHVLQAGLDFCKDPVSDDATKLTDLNCINDKQAVEEKGSLILEKSYSENYEPGKSKVNQILEIFETFAPSDKTRISKEDKIARLDSTTESRSSNLASVDAIELIQLRHNVIELQEKEMRLEAELLEYYSLKEKQKAHLEAQQQLKKKNEEIEKLNSKFRHLEVQMIKLTEEVAGKEDVKRELEVARRKIKELQREIASNAGQTKAQLLLLKEQVAVLQEKEQEALKKDFELEKKFQMLNELEVEVVELRRTNKELQHQKRELRVKLDAAEGKIEELTNLSQSELVARAEAEATALRHANRDLTRQVEGLQMNRFNEVEELVYLRWVNACLRYELRNAQIPAGKISALDLNKDMSPRSQERAKQLMLEYAGPDLLAMRAREYGDNDFDSISPQPSTPTEFGDYDDSASFESFSSRQTSGSKKSKLIRKLKIWGKSKEDVAASPGAAGLGHRQPSFKNPLEALILRNNSDTISIITSGTRDLDCSVLMKSASDCSQSSITDTSTNGEDDRTENMRPIRTGAPATEDFEISNGVAASFQLMAKSVANVMDDKYPAFKDRHKLALAREKDIKEKAEQARMEKLAGQTMSDNRPDIPGEQSNAPSSKKPSLNVAIPEKLAPLHVPKPEKPASTEKLNNVSKLLDKAVSIKIPEKQNALVTNEVKSERSPEIGQLKLSEIQKRPPRVARPPPKPSSSGTVADITNLPLKASGIPPPPPPPTRASGPTILPAPPGGPRPGAPPPPPPPPGNLTRVQDTAHKVHRAPEVVEFYQSLMKRDQTRKGPTSTGVADANVIEARNNMIGEIENRSAFLLAVKADVETQAEFVQSLATEVRAGAFTKIEDVVSFVNWLDEELAFLVDERAVLKHFDWPESKCDALREAAFEYQDLKKLESDITTFDDEPRLSCDSALKKMLTLLEKAEQSVYALLRTRDMAVARYKEFNIPTYWLLDSGQVGQIKLASVQLARNYMKRVAMELDSASTAPEKEPMREFLLLQGVRFAFRVHQFAGGFDEESMRAFEELRSRATNSKQPPAES